MKQEPHGRIAYERVTPPDEYEVAYAVTLDGRAVGYVGKFMVEKRAYNAFSNVRWRWFSADEQGSTAETSRRNAVGKLLTEGLGMTYTEAWETIGPL